MQDEKRTAVYPGERVLSTREENLENGIPVLSSVWNEIIKLQQ